MKSFFDYSSPYRTPYFLENAEFEIQMTLLEKIIPFIILIIIGYLIFKYKNKFSQDEQLDKKIRVTTGIIFTMLYLSHFILRFAIYGFDTIVLPFQLCSIAMFLAIILIFTKNRTVYAFVFYAGLLGALISYLTPNHGYNAMYYRYYQFYIAHGILILTPIYFLFVHKYVPNLKETIYSFAILQSLAIFMVIFNYFNNTDFMFVFVDKAKIEKFPAISSFGGIPFYLIWVEITAIVLFTVIYLIIRKVTKGGSYESN